MVKFTKSVNANSHQRFKSMNVLLVPFLLDLYIICLLVDTNRIIFSLYCN